MILFITHRQTSSGLIFVLEDCFQIFASWATRQRTLWVFIVAACYLRISTYISRACISYPVMTNHGFPPLRLGYEDYHFCIVHSDVCMKKHILSFAPIWARFTVLDVPCYLRNWWHVMNFTNLRTPSECSARWDNYSDCSDCNSSIMNRYDTTLILMPPSLHVCASAWVAWGFTDTF